MWSCPSFSTHKHTHTHTHTHTHIVRALSEPKCTWRTHTRLYSLLWQPTATVHTYCDTLIIQRRCTEGIMSCTFCSHSFLTPSRASSIHALRAPRILPDTLSARFCTPFRPKASLYVTLRSLIRCVTSPVKTSLLVPDPFFFFSFCSSPTKRWKLSSYSYFRISPQDSADPKSP